MFLKSNTKAFIYITHFIFNIIDPKDFKVKFYWPIIEKKFENSYRISSVDFINNLIEKHKLSQEKIKMTTVIHPHGKKFLSLLLDLVMLAIKEVIKRRKFSTGRSFDITKVEEVATNMKQIENELVNDIESESNYIKRKSEAISQLISHIYSADEFGVSFEDFIKSWHDHNRFRMISINNRNDEIEQIYHKAHQLRDQALKMLATKEYKSFAPSPEDVRDLVEHFEGIRGSNDDTPSFSWLLTQVHKVLPAINKFVACFTLDPSNINGEELKVLKKCFSKFDKIQVRLEDLTKKYREIITKIVEDLKKASDEQTRLTEENQFPEDLATKAEIERRELEVLEVFNDPVLHSDFSKEGFRRVPVLKNRLAFRILDEGKDFANESKFGMSMRPPSANKTKLNESSRMLPPTKPQNSRRRLDAMEMLENAITNRRNLNSTRITGVIPKNNMRTATNPHFCSTLLSPDLRQVQFDCSTVSSISKASPLINEPFLESMFGDSIKIPDDQSKHDFNDPRQDKRSLDFDFSVAKKSSPLVVADLLNVRPKIIVEESQKTCSEFSVTETTIKAETSTSISFETLNTMIAQGDSFNSSDEDLFNVSDTVLQQFADCM